ncbi:MAG: hypothetical protein EBU66_20135 [Bacteroidetes bacterium]|nr:hypothetical protein [Bacteroidota bacterium]
MPIYIPSDVQTDTQTSAYIRQNCNKKNKDPLDTVLRGKTIHVPWGHVKQDIIDYEQDPDGFRTRTKYANTCIEIPIGSLVLIPDGKKGLIVRLTSDVKSGVMSSLCTAVTPRNCGHLFVRGRNRCIECHNSIQENFNPSDLQKISAHLNNGSNIEPFWSLYRDVEIIGEAYYNGIDGRSLAGPDSAGKWSRYWRLVA